jgi:hypothetical protein
MQPMNLLPVSTPSKATSLSGTNPWKHLSLLSTAYPQNPVSWMASGIRPVISARRSASWEKHGQMQVCQFGANFAENIQSAETLVHQFHQINPNSQSKETVKRKRRSNMLPLLLERPPSRRRSRTCPLHPQNSSPQTPTKPSGQREARATPPALCSSRTEQILVRRRRRRRRRAPPTAAAAKAS